MSILNILIVYMRKIIFILIPFFILSNCASITESKNQSMSVSTGDVTGAMCTLSNSKGSYYVNSTPGSVMVRNACDQLTVTCKKDGYVAANPAAGAVQDQSKGMAWGNILFGGLIGIAVDRQTGAGCTYSQQNIIFPMQKVSSKNNAFLLPLRSEHLPAFEIFDVVACLGVLYHRRSPIDQLKELHSFLKPQGKLLLETLILPKKEKEEIIIPEDRYAKMSNVWFIPSEKALQIMLKRSGFSQIEAVDVTRTSVEEQRATKWMDFQSLADFLDPDDSDKTIEGYPAPTRALIIATKP